MNKRKLFCPSLQTHPSSHTSIRGLRDDWIYWRRDAESFENSVETESEYGQLSYKWHILSFWLSWLAVKTLVGVTTVSGKKEKSYSQCDTKKLIVILKYSAFEAVQVLNSCVGSNLGLWIIYCHCSQMRARLHKYVSTGAI